jgi:phage repressor protein C with HTH and peptisase S24 domain
MSPYINSGDIVMIDTGQNQIQDHQIYAIEHSGEVRIKRLSKRFDGGLMIRSDGQGFPEESISPDQVPSLRILGKCLWRGG